MEQINKLAEQRLHVLQLAQELGNVTEACRRNRMNRASFYQWKRRFQSQGVEGLQNLPPIAKSHPQTVPAAIRNRILELALEHPSYGCNKLEKLHSLEGKFVSNTTIQKILIANNIGTRQGRWLALELMDAQWGTKLSKDQLAFIDKLNPSFRERNFQSSAPGKLLFQRTFIVGDFKYAGRVYMNLVIDTYGSYAFGSLHDAKQPEDPTALVFKEVLPFYMKHGLNVEAVVKDHKKEQFGTDSHPYTLYQCVNRSAIDLIQVLPPQPNGFVDRFRDTVLNEFFRTFFKKKQCDSVIILQDRLNKWLNEYNYERPHLGYRNQGRRPWETIELFLNGTPVL